MKEVKLDCGLRECSVFGGVLRCNPTDPNLYTRFLELAPQLAETEQRLYLCQGDLLQALQKADREMKILLGKIFPGNDFDDLLQGVNLLAVGENGNRVITNLLESLEPILQEGAEAFAQAKTQNALEKAKARRGKPV